MAAGPFQGPQAARRRPPPRSGDNASGTLLIKRGLASLAEQAVAALGVTRLLLVRSAQKPVVARLAHPAERLAAWMLSIVRFMVPASEQPVRAAKVAELVDVALAIAPPGMHVAAPEMVWQAAQGQLQAVASA